MNLTNDTYVIVVGSKDREERYYRDAKGWIKVSTRGRIFRATAEQVLNHLLPAIALSADTREPLHPEVIVRVEHYESPEARFSAKEREWAA